MKKYYLILLMAVTTTFAFGQIDGTWRVAPMAQSLAVGPAKGDFSWWAIDNAGVQTRACFFDDTYVFNKDGSFENVMGSETWLEPWQGVASESCGAPVAPHDGSNTSMLWTYDASAGTVTLAGVGAHLALPKVINGKEISDAKDAPASITYPVVLSPTNDTMTIDIDFGGGFWHFVLVKDGTSSVEDVEQDMFNVFPNPATDEITINSTESVDQVVIYDVTGKEVFSQVGVAANETINVATLNRGLYMIEVRSGVKKSTKRLVLN